MHQFRLYKKTKDVLDNYLLIAAIVVALLLAGLFVMLWKARG